MSHTKDIARDLDPHKPARFAMAFWGSRYAQSGLGSMGFWDTLTHSERELCRKAVTRIEAARDETEREKATKP